jgi:hypothetical protein
LDKIEANRFRSAVLSQFDISDFNCPLAVTLTLKQCYRVNGIVDWIDPIKASQNLRHFLNVLNRKSFGKVGVRKERRLDCYPVLEDAAGRLHYHLCLEKPKTRTPEQFTALIHQVWGKTRFGYREIDVRPCDDGWIDYMTKFRSKPNLPDSIDWNNYSNSGRAV